MITQKLMGDQQMTFHRGYEVNIKGKHLVIDGCKGIIAKWHHDNVYTVLIISSGPYFNKEFILKASEMEMVSDRVT